MTPTMTRRLNPRPKMLGVRRPAGDRAVEGMLRDIAFVLKMTQRVKQAILTGEPLPGTTDR
jgi:hypothetical protein